jgi:hypothetical protein
MFTNLRHTETLQLLGIGALVVSHIETTPHNITFLSPL